MRFDVQYDIDKKIINFVAIVSVLILVSALIGAAICLFILKGF